MTCLSGPASVSDDVGLRFRVPLNVIHCLFRSVAHPMQPHTCIQKDMLDATYTHLDTSGNPGRKRKNMGHPDYRWHKSAHTH